MKTSSCAYIEGITNQRIVIIGIEPPPLGGISVHITRAMDRLSAQYNHVALWRAESKLRRFFPLYIVRLFIWLVRHRADQLYYHATYLRNAVIELWFLKLCKRIFGYQLHIVDHDCRHLKSRSPFWLKIYKKIVTAAQSVICIGQSVKQSYTDHGIVADHIVIDDAFIPPSANQMAQSKIRHPSSLAIFIKDHTPILLMSAAHIMRIEGQDIYGIDSALAMVVALKRDYPDIGLIIGLPEIADQSYFQQLICSMKELEVAEHVYIRHGNNELWPLFKDTDIFLRPTRSDGDSISVREALYFNLPVVASDVCQRPAGVHLFKAGNAIDGARIITKLLEEYVYGSQKQRNSVHSQSMP